LRWRPRCQLAAAEKAPAAFTAEVGATVTAGKGTTTALKLAAMGSGKGTAVAMALITLFLTIATGMGIASYLAVHARQCGQSRL